MTDNTPPFAILTAEELAETIENWRSISVMLGKDEEISKLFGMAMASGMNECRLDAAFGELDEVSVSLLDTVSRLTKRIEELERKTCNCCNNNDVDWNMTFGGISTQGVGSGPHVDDTNAKITW